MVDKELPMDAVGVLGLPAREGISIASVPIVATNVVTLASVSALLMMKIEFG